MGLVHRRRWHDSWTLEDGQDLPGRWPMSRKNHRQNTIPRNRRDQGILGDGDMALYPEFKTLRVLEKMLEG